MGGIVSEGMIGSAAVPPQLSGPDQNAGGLVEALRRGLHPASLRSNQVQASFNRPIYANLFDGEGGERSSLARGGRKSWLRRLLHRPNRPERAGLRKNGQARPS